MKFSDITIEFGSHQFQEATISPEMLTTATKCTLIVTLKTCNFTTIQLLLNTSDFISANICAVHETS